MVSPRLEDRNDLGAIHNQGRRLSNHGGSRREWIVTTYAALSFRSLPAATGSHIANSDGANPREPRAPQSD